MGLPSASLPVCARGYRERDFALVCGREGVGVCSLRGLLSRLSSAVYCIPVTAPGSALASRARHALVTRSHILPRALRKRAARHGRPEEAFGREGERARCPVTWLSYNRWKSSYSSFIVNCLFRDLISRDMAEVNPRFPAD